MRVIQIGTDAKIFDEGSRVRERIATYAGFVDDLVVVIPVVKRSHEVKENNLTLIPVYGKNKIFSYLNLLIFLLRYKIDRGDIIFTENIFELGIIGVLVKKLKGCQWIGQVHTDFASMYFKKHSLHQRLQNLIARCVVGYCDRIRVVSGRIERSLIELGVDPKKILVLPILYDANPKSQREIQANLGEIRFLSLGRLVSEKNVDKVIKVFQKINERAHGKKTSLTIVGEGPLKKELEGQAVFSKNIYFEPWCEDLGLIFSRFDCHILASSYEGYGLVVIEAAAHGVATVMSDVGCAGEFIIDGRNGLVFEPENWEDLESKLMQYIDNPELLMHHRHEAYTSSKNLITKEEYLRIYASIFNL